MRGRVRASMDPVELMGAYAMKVVLSFLLLAGLSVFGTSVANAQTAPADPPPLPPIMPAPQDPPATTAPSDARPMTLPNATPLPLPRSGGRCAHENATS
jgi:hypothetical protein